MTAELVLITGGTGLVGYATIVEALHQGYRVRAAVRSQEKAELIKEAQSGLCTTQLEFVIVPDIAKEGAFDIAVEGVDAIIHTASPLPNSNITDFDEQLIKPAVHGTTGIVYSALRERKVRRLVITPSIAAIFPWTEDVFTADQKVAIPDLPYENVTFAYRASKIAAHHAAQTFIDQQKPHVNVQRVLPSYVVGKHRAVYASAYDARRALDDTISADEPVGPYASLRTRHIYHLRS